MAEVISKAAAAHISPANGYAGDITPEGVWQVLKDSPDAAFVDVRTKAEWAFVGVPDLSGAGKSAALIEWVQFPDMSPNANFVDDVKKVVQSTDTPLFFLCRSGQRSAAAAKALTAAGYGAAYNVIGGFEGDRNQNGHRATLNGWKVAGLPWVQN